MTNKKLWATNTRAKEIELLDSRTRKPAAIEGRNILQPPPLVTRRKKHLKKKEVLCTRAQQREVTRCTSLKQTLCATAI